jgi:large subunit ribosomal protein L21
MYAIVRINGNQARVTPDEVIEVPRLTGEPGQTLTFDEVLLVADGDQVHVGTPGVKGAAVTAEVVDHIRGPKLRIFKFKRRHDYRRRRGHRDAITRLRVTGIQFK